MLWQEIHHIQLQTYSGSKISKSIGHANRQSVVNMNLSDKIKLVCNYKRRLESSGLSDKISQSNNVIIILTHNSEVSNSLIFTLFKI